jgi:hypothetical protein
MYLPLPPPPSLQGRLDALGNERDAEALFKSHAHDLMDKARAGLKALITEKLGPLIPGEGGAWV